ncbi:MAG: hypothetical protein NZZ41_06880 [Candidatus Dojkabacteria bacterium]|nr:hypothetical protein [Candidatus Dojkabacteria bacterium]
MFLLTPSDLQNTVLYNNRISDINIYIREAELKFWYDLCPSFASLLENSSPTAVFKTLINDPLYFVERYRDYMPFFVYNFLLKQGILASGDVKKENHNGFLYCKGVFGLKKIYEYLNYVLESHKFLFYDSNLGYCLFEKSYKGYLLPPPIEGAVYVDESGNVYTISSITSTYPFQIYLNPTPSSDINLTSRIYCEPKKFLYI